MYILSGRAPHINRRLLLKDEPEVRKHDFDPVTMDTSTDHRVQMKQILYSKSALQRSINPAVKKEAGNYNWNYGDEVPPEWQSTTKAEYIQKPLVFDSKRDDIASYIKGSHFSLHGPEAKLPVARSVTKSDYLPKDLVGSTQIVNELLKKQSTGVHYPPIFRDETALTMSRPVTDPTRHSFSLAASLLKKSDAHAKNATHISLGNDDEARSSKWQSVSSSVMVAHPRQAKPPASEYELLEKKRSTVLDHPDIKPGPHISVQNEDYKPVDVERSRLMVDNAASIKDLKSTHFSLGNDSNMTHISQYQSNFNSSNLVGADPLRPRTSRDNSGSKQCIIVEDYEDRLTGQSSHRSDFSYPTHGTTVTSLRLNSAANHIKDMNLKTSISFASEELLGTNKSASLSITATEYRNPVLRDADIAREAYKRKVLVKPGATNYNHLDMGEALTKNSVAHADYGACDLGTKRKLQPSNDFKAMIKMDHFSIGDPNYNGKLDDVLDRQFSMTRKHYNDPGYNLSNADIEAIRPAGLISNNGRNKRETFEDTLSKTIGRDVNADTSKFSVTSSTYIPFVNIPKVLPFVPSKQDQITDYLHPTTTKSDSLVSDGAQKTYVPIQDWSTSYRRTYISPEFMKFVNDA